MHGHFPNMNNCVTSTRDSHVPGAKFFPPPKPVSTGSDCAVPDRVYPMLFPVPNGYTFPHAPRNEEYLPNVVVPLGQCGYLMAGFQPLGDGHFHSMTEPDAGYPRFSRRVAKWLAGSGFSVISITDDPRDEAWSDTVTQDTDEALAFIGALADGAAAGALDTSRNVCLYIADTRLIVDDDLIDSSRTAPTAAMDAGLRALLIGDPTITGVWVVTAESTHAVTRPSSLDLAVEYSATIMRVGRNVQPTVETRRVLPTGEVTNTGASALSPLVLPDES